MLTHRELFTAMALKRAGTRSDATEADNAEIARDCVDLAEKTCTVLEVKPEDVVVVPNRRAVL